MHIQPWFNAYPGHRILLSGFVEGNALLCGFYSRSSVPPVTVPNSSSNSLAHGIQYMTDNRWAPSTSQLAGSDTYAQITETVQDFNLSEYPQGSSPTAVQTLLHVPGARGPAPMPRSLSPCGSGAWEQHPMSHDYTGAVNASGDLVNVSASPTSRRGMSGGGWAGRLSCYGAYTHARAEAGDAIRNPYVQSFVKLLVRSKA